ncbi:hypothetical protein HAX54_009078 [Datura stramonium]|uniref:Uncharacterized protein n=1 Tax=Datura stramonium TaxID=4076 RepID=A0ABS8RW45_DATST|nr:hypothetical protein [Datura stramonium]
MRVLNKKVDPCSMDQSNVPSNISLLDNKHGEVENGLLNPNISIEDVASLESSDAQLLPQGNLEIQAERPHLLKRILFKKKRWKKSMMKVLNEKVDPCSLGLNNVPSNPSLLDNKHGEVESGLLNSNISINDAVSSKRKATEALCMADVNFSLSAPSSDLVNELEQPKRDDVKVINGSIEGEVSFLERWKNFGRKL